MFLSFKLEPCLPKIWVWWWTDVGDNVMALDGEWGEGLQELPDTIPVWSSASRGVARGDGKCKLVRSGKDPVLLEIGTCTDPDSSWVG